MNDSGAKVAEDIPGDEEIRPYRIHVSSKYLELTKRKLELTRLPHEVAEPKSKDWWEPKPHVEPLIDFWLEHFSWRQHEELLNDTLPQFRASFPVPGTDAHARLHFIHVRSSQPGAIPLLLLPPFPFTSLSLGHLVKPLAEPEDTRNGQPFHIVIPSLPGLGFSDALPGTAPAVAATAAILDILMKRLSYDHYLVSNTGSASSSPAEIDWDLASRLATRHASSCLGAHLIDPPLAAPTVRDAPWEWTKFAIARFFNAPILGYTAADLAALTHAAPAPRQGRGRPAPSPSQLGLHHVGILEPNTLAFALCDSPVGLLVFLLKSLRTIGPRKDFQPAEIITMAMLAWLPGPEAALRYWAHCVAHPEQSTAVMSVSSTRRPRVAITVFLGNDDAVAPGGSDDVELVNLPTPAPHRYTCPGWASRKFDVVHATRATGEPGLLAWERPEIIVAGVTGLARQVLASDKRLRPAVPENIAPLEEVVVGGAAEAQPVAETEPKLDTLKPPPVARHTSSETQGESWRLQGTREDAPEGADDLDGASPNTLVVTTPGNSPSPLPTKGPIL